MEAIGQLSGGIAHDFNNLLSVVLCSLDLMMMKMMPGDENLRLAQLASNAGMRGADLVKKIMVVSRKQALQPRPLELNPLLSELREFLERSLGTSIKVQMALEADPWHAVVDAAQLQTAILNLATNARDAMPHGGELLLQTRSVVLDESAEFYFSGIPPGDYVMISVSDNGSGMTPEIAAKAFDPFYTTKSKGYGTGLGLSMLYGFVKQSCGYVRLVSQPGQGTTVHLYFPRFAGLQSVAIEAPGNTAKREISKHKRILIVDDNEELAMCAEAVLMKEGYETVVVHTAEDALGALCSEVPIDLMFSDIVLAGPMSGLELYQQAVQKDPHLKVLFTSGFFQNAQAVSGLELRPEQVLCKPYRSEDLCERIRALANSVQQKSLRPPPPGSCME